jgi:hypothetical protein
MRAAMYAKGIEIYCAPTADTRASWIASMRHIAAEGRCFVLSCNQFALCREFPADYRSVFGDDPDTVVTRGGSFIVDPFGNFLAGTNMEGEAILTAANDLAQTRRDKFDLDVVGHCARPDFFQLLVDERPKQPVTTHAFRATCQTEPGTQTDGAMLRDWTNGSGSALPRAPITTRNTDVGASTKSLPVLKLTAPPKLHRGNS